jgi:hypothetical protein
MPNDYILCSNNNNNNNNIDREVAIDFTICNSVDLFAVNCDSNRTFYMYWNLDHISAPPGKDQVFP